MFGKKKNGGSDAMIVKQFCDVRSCGLQLISTIRRCGYG